MLSVNSIIAILVYDWIGLGFLRRGWIKLEHRAAARSLPASVYGSSPTCSAGGRGDKNSMSVGILILDDERPKSSLDAFSAHNFRTWPWSAHTCSHVLSS
jgi:hypothetical protein